MINEIASNVQVLNVFAVIGGLTLTIVFFTLGLLAENQPVKVKVKK